MTHRIADAGDDVTSEASFDDDDASEDERDGNLLEYVAALEACHYFDSGALEPAQLCFLF